MSDQGKKDAATRAVEKLVEQGLLDEFQKYNIAQAIRQEYETDAAPSPAAQPAPDEVTPTMEARGRAIHDNDCPKFHDFFHKHALGSLERSSCLACGQVGEKAVDHLELPDVYVCVTCKAKLDAAT